MEKNNLVREEAVERSAVVFTTIVSIAAIVISYFNHGILAYNDATAHINTARRVIDNLQPGLVQIGSVWLPLLHILEIPFVSIDFFWHTGLAGSIVSAVSFIFATYFLYKLVFYVTHNVFAGIVTTFVFITNANLLYLQTTPMFEPLLMVTAVGSVYFLTRWTKEQNIKFLVYAGFFTMLATLTRYDGWAFFIVTSAYVFIQSLRIKKSWDGPFLIYIVMGGFGILLWLIYNKIIFGDPLFFMRSEYSAAAQQQILFKRGQLPAKHDIGLSFLTYSISMILNLGVLPSVFFTFGLFYYLVKNIKHIFSLAPLILLTPYFFNIISLYLGQSVIWLPMLRPYFESYFNARYGILMLPAAAFFIGYLSSTTTILAVIFLFLSILQLLFFVRPELFPLPNYFGGMLTLKDTVSSVNKQTLNASTFLHQHYDSGLILVSSASEDAFIFHTQLPLKKFITEGTGYYWRNSLKSLNLYARWIVFFNDKSDRVGKNISQKQLNLGFLKIYSDQTYQIWRRK